MITNASCEKSFNLIIYIYIYVVLNKTINFSFCEQHVVKLWLMSHKNHKICGYLYFLCVLRTLTTQFLLSPSVPPGSDHVSPSTLPSSVFSSPTFWLMSLKYHTVPPFCRFFVPLPSLFQSYFCSTNPHLFICPFLPFPHTLMSPPPTAPQGLIISLQLLRGDLEQIRRENQAVFNRALALTRKLGFPDVILPGKTAAE